MNTTHSPNSFGVLALCSLLGAPLLTACDSGDDVDEYGHERAAADPNSLTRASEDAIIEAMEFEPSPEVFEYTGQIDDLDAPWRRGPRPGPLRAEPEGETHDASDDLVDLLTRDGRTYRQRLGTQGLHTGTISDFEASPTPIEGEDPDLDEAIDSLTLRELITGGVDNRIRSTATSKQGVMVKIAGTSTSTNTTCSASMIAPRVFLTAAHCVTDSNGDWSYGSADWVMPSVRGRSFSGSNTALDSNDTPWGARQVTRLIKPSAWTGGGSKYDYAILIIGDHAPDNAGTIEWDPQPAKFANDDCDDLDGLTVNLRGYPGRTKTCASASSEDNGQCGGYAYVEAKPVDECTTNSIYYYLDSQEGQSGSPVYRYSAVTGVRTVVGINRGTFGSRNYGHKIRSGSYGAICAAVEDPANFSSHFTNPSC
ncbi:MAG: trypsin-like serine protease [Deltaproteobacteria bacterium]|nr:trypsin-like serine protease [Deltaproteobacteria bacterium]